MNVEREYLSLGTARLEKPELITFGKEYQTFVFRFRGGRPAENTVYVSPGFSAEPTYAGADVRDTIAFGVDPTVVRVLRLATPTSQISVINTLQGGVYLEVYAIDGDAEAETSSVEIAAAIAAALAGLTVTATITGPMPIDAVTWSAGAAVAMGAASASIIAANALRKKLIIQNTGAVPVAIALRAAAAVFATDIIIPVNGAYQESGEGQFCYRGEVRGITGGAAGEVRVIEAT